MISFAVVYTIAVSCVCQLDYSPLELSKLVPKDAVELKIEGAELSDSETVVIKDVGTLKTGLTYFFNLPIYNLTDVPVKVEKIESSCGCLTAVPASAEKVMFVEPKSSSPVLVIVKPQYTNSTYEKLLKIEASNGKKLRIGVVGKFVPPLSLKTTQFVLGGKTRRFVSELEIVNGWDIARISVDDPTKAVSVVKSTAESIEIEVSEETIWRCEAAGLVTSVLQVRDLATSGLLCNVPLTITSRRAFVCKPLGELIDAGNGRFTGQVLLFGDLEKVDLNSLELRGDDKLKLNFAVASKGGRVARIDLDLEVISPTDKNTVELKLSFVDKISEAVLGVFQTRFKGE